MRNNWLRQFVQPWKDWKRIEAKSEIPLNEAIMVHMRRKVHTVSTKIHMSCSSINNPKSKTSNMHALS